MTTKVRSPRQTTEILLRRRPALGQPAEHAVISPLRHPARPLAFGRLDDVLAPPPRPEVLQAHAAPEVAPDAPDPAPAPPGAAPDADSASGARSSGSPFRATSSRTSDKNAASGTPCSGFGHPRRFTPTVPAATSRSPTTST